MYLWSVVVFTSIILCVYCNDKDAGNLYEVLPPIFHIDDYDKCKLEQKTFCKVSVLLKNKEQNESYYWKLIEESINDFRAYNHNELFHAICTDNFCPELSISVKKDWNKTLSDCYTRKYIHLGLEAEIVSYNCENHDDVYSAGIVDYLWMFCVVSYVILAVVSVYYDYRIQNGDSNGNVRSEDVGKRVLTPFSVLSNWQKLRLGNNSATYQKLKCIQGIRFYNMLLIIFCHTYSSYIGGYVHNTSYIENISKSLLKLAIRNMMVFLVQTFFLFSAFFLSYHTFHTMENNKRFNLKFILITFLNRYIRILPPVIVMIGFGITVWVVKLFNGPIKDLYSDLEYQRCQKNWWTTLLFINNHYNQHDTCYFITWYLAADTQLYVLSLVILSLIWIFKKKTKLILILALLVGLFIPMIMSYEYSLDIIYRITPENSKNNKFRSFEFNAIYSSSYANMATFMVGLICGYLYNKYENQYFFKNPKSKLLWLLCFLGLPVLIIFTSCFYYSKYVNAILCGILKPLYAIGIAVGVFGMSQKVGGIIKRICEWEPAVFMGNFTYSTYVVHYGIVFYRTATAKQPLIISDFILMKSFILDTIFSFLCGFLMHILVEMPFQQIQRRILPQAREVLKPEANERKDK